VMKPTNLRNRNNSATVGRFNLSPYRGVPIRGEVST